MVIDETELEGLTEDQRDAYIALKEGRNVFLSGNAGTGKSYVLNRFIDDLEARSVPYTAMAPTGIAALNMHNGSTIHRTLQVSAGVCNPSEKIRPRKVLTVAEVIIIDEISMCRIDLFDYVMRMISDAQVSSGRKQVVLVGDFFQLPPVITEDDRAILMKLYPGNFEGWAFESDYWDGFDFEPHILKKVVRQDDPEYIGNLNLARNGDESCIPYFNEHSVSDRKYAPKDALFLCSNNRLASPTFWRRRRLRRSRPKSPAHLSGRLFHGSAKTHPAGTINPRGISFRERYFNANRDCRKRGVPARPCSPDGRWRRSTRRYSGAGDAPAARIDLFQYRNRGRHS